ncbi:MAG: hypothetical protein JO299_11230 [Gammaproteobacteria bacterium]|nr:hypothetical protein [Gammaproteobacteria bacterium]
MPELNDPQLRETPLPLAHRLSLRDDKVSIVALIHKRRQPVVADIAPED